MAKYADLKNEIAKLEAQAEEARKAELAQVKKEIRELMDAYGLTPEDFASVRGNKSKAKVRDLEPQYRDPISGSTWSGKGPRPVWLKEALAADASKTKEDFAIKAAA